MIVPITFFVGGLRGVRKTDRWVIEVFGEFYVIRQPGLQWVCPLLMNVQAIVDIREIKLPLFEEPIKIDFRNGSAGPKGAVGFLKIKGENREEIDESVKRAVYNIEGWRSAAIILIQNGLRSFLNSMTIEEGLEKGKGGYNLLDRMSESKNKKHQKAANGIETALSNWGFELTRVVVEDFDLDPVVIQAREALFRKQRDREMAVLERGIRAEQTMGANVDMVTIALGKDPSKKKERHKYPEDKATELADDYTTRQISADAGALVDARGEGLGGDIIGILGGVAKAVKPGTSKAKNP